MKLQTGSRQIIVNTPSVYENPTPPKEDLMDRSDEHKDEEEHDTSERVGIKSRKRGQKNHVTQ